MPHAQTCPACNHVWKICPCCRQSRSPHAYARNPRTSDGLDGLCADCRKAAQMNRRRARSLAAMTAVAAAQGQRLRASVKIPLNKSVVRRMERKARKS